MASGDAVVGACLSVMTDADHLSDDHDDDGLVLLVDRCLTAAARATARAQCGLISTAQLATAGVSTSTISRRVRAADWPLAASGVVDLAVPMAEKPSVRYREKRSVHRALLALGPNAVAVGYSALVLHGVQGLPVDHEPEVALRGTCHAPSREGIRVRRFTLERVVQMDGLPAEPLVQALAHAALRSGPMIALGLIDSALHQHLIDEEDVTAIWRLTRGRRGARALAPMWRLIDRRRESPLESWAYWTLTRAGLEPTDIQVEIVDASGRLLARGDLGYQLQDDTWLLVDMHGREPHESWDKVRSDAWRTNTLSADPSILPLTAFNEDLKNGRLVETVTRRLSGVPRHPRAGRARRAAARAA